MNNLSNSPEKKTIKLKLINYKKQLEIFALASLNLNSEISFTDDQNDKMVNDLQYITETMFGKLNTIINANSIKKYCRLKENTILHDSSDCDDSDNDNKSTQSCKLYESDCSVMSFIVDKKRRTVSAPTQCSIIEDTDESIKKNSFVPVTNWNELKLKNQLTDKTENILPDDFFTSSSVYTKPSIYKTKKEYTTLFKKWHYVQILPDVMYFEYLHLADTKFPINNIDNYKDIKFYFRKISNINLGLHKFKRGSEVYFIASNNTLYKINSDNMLLPGIFNNALQCWNPEK